MIGVPRIEPETALGLCLAASALLAGCVEVLPAAVPEPRLLGAQAVDVEPSSEGPYVGLILGESIVGSLEELAFAPGLEVQKVEPGSPARRAGIRRGDRITAVAGMELETLDQWAAALAAAQPGDVLRLEAERDQAVSEVELEVASGEAGRLEPPTAWAERLKARAVFATRVPPGGGSSHAVLQELLDQSPLDELPFAAPIRRLDGEDVTSAAELARRLAACDFGEDVCFEIETDEGLEEFDVELWSPPRRLTSLQFPILFDWEAEASGDSSSLDIIDLWLVSLYSYERDGQSRKHRFLSLFEFASGTGELTEAEDDPDLLGDEDAGPGGRP